MPHKGEASAEEKVRIVEDYLSGKVGCSEAGRIAGVDEETIRRWVSRYKTEGLTGFLPQERNRSYSKETKLAAAMDYLVGKGSLRINRALHIQSTIKFRRRGCTRSAASPEYVAKNYLGRQFHDDAPNTKWLTDVTEFKYYAFALAA